MSKVAPNPDNTMGGPPGCGLIATKLYARTARANFVARPRLVKLLDDGLSANLILVSAQAGFGKTTVLSEWLSGKDEGRGTLAPHANTGVKDEGKPSGIPDTHSSHLHRTAFGAVQVSLILHPFRFAWLSLDSADNDPARFWSYVILALQGLRDELGETALAQLRSPQPPPIQQILPSLLNEIDSFQDRGILVLDDYHVITSTAVHASLTYFLDNLPSNLHLVLSTRSDPPIPIAKLRSRSQVVEIRTEDLRFKPDEAAAFLHQTMGLALSSAQVAALDERTEGWIAGLQMAALSMRGRDDVDGFIRAFAGTNRFIMEYLLEEVLAREPAEVQSFLLQTAILSRMTGPLCDAVTGMVGGEEMLENLERRNLFVVPLDDNRRWYRYHHLFGDLLQARLHQSGSDAVARLFFRASEWCEREGQVADAVSYALAAKDYDRTSDLIVRHWGHTANSGEVDTVGFWLDALPEDMVKNSAPLGIAYCWVLWLKGQIGAIEARLTDAERAFGERVVPKGSGANDPVYAGMPAHLAVLRSIVARHHNEFETAIEHAERALSLAPENLPSEDNAQLRAVIFLALASAYDGAGDLERTIKSYTETIRWSRIGTNPLGVAGITFRLIAPLRLLGRLRAADEACREALVYIQAQGMSRLPAAGLLHLAMGEVLLERNDLEAADAQLSLSFELGKWSGRFDASRNVTRARLRLARQDTNGALAAVQDAEMTLGEPTPPLAKAELLALRAKILVRQGSVSKAAQCILEAVRLAGGDRGQAGEMVTIAACRVHLAQRKPEALVELTRSLTAAEEAGRLGAAIEMRILRSLILARQGEMRDAETDVERALALAEPEGYVRVFVDEGKPMQALLAQWLAHASAGPRRDYCLHLLSQFTADPHVVTAAQGQVTSAGDLVEPLTPRELEVLRLVCAGDSNQRIADTLVITVSAVKKHTGNILGKLGVTSRAQAMVKARQLGLLSKDD